jgi:hypothetical protein
MKNLSGLTFGELTVIEFSHRVKNNYFWSCKCECGNIRNLSAATIKYRVVKACCCYGAKNGTTHGFRKHRLYTIYHSMKLRCYYPSSIQFKDYGGRGIRVCDEWLNDKKCFFNWAYENGYSDNLQLDRIENNGSYCPENCRFVTRKVNCRNKINNRLITYNGQTKPVSQWCEELNLSYRLILDRLNNNWPVDSVFTAPLYKRIKGISIA